MRFFYTLSLAAATLLHRASAEDTTALNPEARAAAPRCAVAGNRIVPPYWVTRQSSLSDAAQCGAVCKSSLLCQSYSVNKDGCSLYLLPLYDSIRQGSNPSTFYDRACATKTDLCNVNGLSTTRPIVDSAVFLDNSWSGCNRLCKKNSACKSFSLGSGTCRLYGRPSYQNVAIDQRSNLAFWDITCALAISTYPAFVTPTSPVPVIKQTEAAVTPTVPPAYTPLVTDSPPFVATGPAPAHGGFANDDDFTDSYTYTEYELPTVTVLGSNPITTGIPQPAFSPAPCMMSTGPQAQFSLLDANFVPLVSKTSNQIGPIAQPTVQPAASDPLSKTDPQAIAFPAFYLQAPAGAPAGTYDLVYAGKTTQYLAMNQKGNIVLTGTSTGPNYVNGLATTIFTFNCNGKIGITQGGTTYSWASGSGLTTATAGGTAHMLALPVNHPVVAKAKRDKTRLLARAKSLQEKLERREQVLQHDLDKRLNSYQTGNAPKCPRAPDNLVPYVRANYKLNQGNVCDNLPDWWQLSPFSFDGSCAVQSLCFDQCQSFGWDSCTGIFTVMAMTSCVSNFGGSWWDIIPLVACTAQATYFSVYAGTNPGRELFNTAQKSMCVCYCSNIGDTCAYSENNFYCVNLKGTDNNNCGNCGRQCPPNTTCKGGDCGCPGDQCGKTCLNLANNPNNCGKCGNVCNPKYCVNGQCYVPQPGTCAPDPPIRNGDFTNANFYQDWETGVLPNQPGCTAGGNVIIGRSVDAGDSKNFFPQMSSLPSSGCAASIIQRQVKLCPGFNYQLKFNARYIAGKTVGAGTFTGTAKCSITWALGTAVTATNFGNFQHNSWDVSDARYKDYPPWTFNVKKGDPGLTKKSENFFVDLIGVVYCTPQKADDGGAIIVGGIDIEQIGTV
ncbi:hypothetical protein QQS21_000319 [Conoideocrella luteorostrata]|uniref:Apple domain-containing protein n=1 Tax=Conoideocrella luteorostrata TaxID=1105319 RepID=A0AAJ0D156_9HYPO|nr:hypothetical protein QQS21_000319 [Conoideocrella luteorostrata]